MPLITLYGCLPSVIISLQKLGSVKPTTMNKEGNVRDLQNCCKELSV